MLAIHDCLSRTKNPRDGTGRCAVCVDGCDNCRSIAANRTSAAAVGRLICRTCTEILAPGTRVCTNCGRNPKADPPANNPESRVSTSRSVPAPAVRRPTVPDFMEAAGGLAKREGITLSAAMSATASRRPELYREHVRNLGTIGALERENARQASKLANVKRRIADLERRRNI